MRTLSGFSSSPVIVHFVTVGARRPEDKEADGGMTYASLVYNRGWLLGVDWGFVPAISNVQGNQADGRQVNSGMSAVVPAWKVAELLDRKEFAVAREQKDNEMKQLLDKESMATEADAGDGW